MALPPPRRVGALPQRTLQPASVSTLRSAFQKPDDVQMRLAGDTGLAPLMGLLTHPHPKIKGLARTVIDSLIKRKAGEAEEEATLNEKSGWPAVSELLSYEDNDARRAALMTLATLANSAPNAQYIDRFIGTATLYQSLSSSHAPTAAGTAALLGSLSQHQALHEPLMKYADLLVSSLSFQKDEARAPLCTTLGNLFLEKENNAELVRLGGVKALTEALASNDVKVQEAAAAAIAGIASEEARAAVSVGAAERLGSLASGNNLAVKKAALAALATLATVETLHETLLKPGLIKLVIDVLLDPAETQAAAEAQLHAARLLNALAVNERSQSVLNNADAWAALSRHQGSRDPATAREAQQALAEAAARGYGTDKSKNLAKEKEAAKMAAQSKELKEREERAAKEKEASAVREKAARDALEIEVRVAKERELAAREAQMKATASSKEAELAEAKQRLAADEVAQRERLKKAEQETLAAREAALAAREAAVLAAEKTAKEREQLAKEQQETSEKKAAAEREAKEVAAKEALLAAREAQLAEREAKEALKAREAQLMERENNVNAKAKDRVEDGAGGIPLTGSNSGSNVLAMSVEKEKEVREAVADMDGDEKAQQKALVKLAVVAKNDRNLDTLRAGGALPKVLAQIEKRTDKAQWLDLLAGIARNEANREAIRELGGLELIMRVVKGPPKPNEVTLLAALRALLVLALNLRNASWLRDAGLLQLVSPLVTPESSRLLALQIIYALIVNNPSTQLRFAQEKGYVTVLALLLPESASNSEARQAAVKVLGAFAENNEKCATALKKAKAIEAIIKQTEGADEPLIVAAILALQAFGSDEKNQYSDIRDAKLLPALARILAISALPLAQAAALTIIRHMSRALGARVGKELNDSLSIIVHLVSVPHDAVARAALGALFELSRENEKLQDQITTEASAILKRMSDDELDSQYWGLGLVWMSAKNKQRREIWRKANAVDYASALRNSPNENVRKGASDLLAVLEKK